jgi:hypothetical protein
MAQSIAWDPNRNAWVVADGDKTLSTEFSLIAGNADGTVRLSAVLDNVALPAGGMDPDRKI